MNRIKLVDEIVDLEWMAFGEVQNEGGRAGCQDNRETFYIMRRSQYLVWTEEMLLRYKADFETALSRGWNMVTEKYARMMESNAREQYEAIKDELPPVSPARKALTDLVAAIQVKWMEEFAARYPNLANKGRAIHSAEDSEYNTSFETYLKGELLTYSPEMLLLYTAFVLDLKKKGKNLSELTMRFMTALYGYASLEIAETKQKYSRAAREIAQQYLSGIGWKKLE